MLKAGQRASTVRKAGVRVTIITTPKAKITRKTKARATTTADASFFDIWVKVPKEQMLDGDGYPELHTKGILCPHGHKRPDYCVLCGGSQICPCKRIKSSCKTCNGSQLCVHTKQWSRCEICREIFTCKHKKHMWRCKRCNKTTQE